jgi:hypothetical protein
LLKSLKNRYDRQALRRNEIPAITYTPGPGVKPGILRIVAVPAPMIKLARLPLTLTHTKNSSQAKK